MNIESYIVKLLHGHDCVIIPGFGGFVCHPVAAEIHPSRHLIYPPSRKIAFNADLKKNDGLLASFISDSENISFNEAMRNIEEYVKSLRTELENKRKFKVDAIGQFTLSAGNNLVFSPEQNANFLLSSFGLSPIQMVPVMEPEKLVLKKVMPQPAVKPAGSKINLRPLELIPAAAMIALMLMIPRLTPQINSTLSSLDFLSFAKENPPPSQTFQKPTYEEILMSIPSFRGKEKKDDLIKESDNESNKEEIAVTIQESDKPEELNVPSVTANESVEIVPSSLKFHIIAGCFSMEENARSLKNELQAKGFSAEIIGKNKHGLTMVSAGGFADVHSAHPVLEKVRTGIINSAWVYKIPE